MGMKKLLIVIAAFVCFQSPAHAASCPRGSIKSNKWRTVIVTTGNWEGEKQQVCQWRDGQRKTICPTFTSRDWGRDVLSKEGRWVPFSNDKLPVHKARGWDADDDLKTFYDPNKNAVVQMFATKIRRGNPAVTDKYIQLIYSTFTIYPCKKVSF